MHPCQLFFLRHWCRPVCAVSLSQCRPQLRPLTTQTTHHSCQSRHLRIFSAWTLLRPDHKLPRYSHRSRAAPQRAGILLIPIPLPAVRQHHLHHRNAQAFPQVFRARSVLSNHHLHSAPAWQCRIPVAVRLLRLARLEVYLLNHNNNNKDKLLRHQPWMICLAIMTMSRARS